MKRTALFGTMAIMIMVVAAGSADAANRTDPGFVGQPAGNVEVGGDGCPPGAFITGPLPWNDTGDTCAGFTDTLNSYAGTCTLPYSYAGEDVIYEMALGAGNLVDFSMDLTGSLGDLALFVISTCGDGSTCVINSQDAIGPGAGPEIIDPTAFTPGTYYVYIDSYYDAGTTASCGTYDLTVNGTVPVELVNFSAE